MKLESVDVLQGAPGGQGVALAPCRGHGAAQPLALHAQREEHVWGPRGERRAAEACHKSPKKSKILEGQHLSQTQGTRQQPASAQGHRAAELVLGPK